MSIVESNFLKCLNLINEFDAICLSKFIQSLLKSKILTKKCKNKNKCLRNEIKVYSVILAILPMFDPINPPIFVRVMPLTRANWHKLPFDWWPISLPSALLKGNIPHEMETFGRDGPMKGRHSASKWWIPRSKCLRTKCPACPKWLWERQKHLEFYTKN